MMSAIENVEYPACWKGAEKTSGFLYRLEVLCVRYRLRPIRYATRGLSVCISWAITARHSSIHSGCMHAGTELISTIQNFPPAAQFAFSNRQYPAELEGRANFNSYSRLPTISSPRTQLPPLAEWLHSLANWLPSS